MKPDTNALRFKLSYYKLPYENEILITNMEVAVIIRMMVRKISYPENVVYFVTIMNAKIC